MTKGFYNLNRFNTTLTIYFFLLKKVNDNNVKPVSHLILKISFLTLDIDPIYG